MFFHDALPMEVQKGVPGSNGTVHTNNRNAFLCHNFHHQPRNLTFAIIIFSCFMLLRKQKVCHVGTEPCILQPARSFLTFFIINHVTLTFSFIIFLCFMHFPKQTLSNFCKIHLNINFLSKREKKIQGNNLKLQLNCFVLMNEFTAILGV